MGYCRNNHGYYIESKKDYEDGEKQLSVDQDWRPTKLSPEQRFHAKVAAREAAKRGRLSLAMRKALDEARSSVRLRRMSPRA